MRRHGFKIFRGSDWKLVLGCVILSPAILLMWLVDRFWYLSAYVLGVVCGVAEGKSLKEAHDWILDDIKSMKAGAKYGGY